MEQMEQDDFYKMVGAIAMFAVVASVFGALQLQNAITEAGVRGNLIANLGSAAAGQETPVAPIPAKLSLITIEDSSSDKYINLQPLVEQLKALNVEIVSEKSLEFSSAEAKQTIEKYGIEKIPALLISGETKKLLEIIKSWDALGSIEEDDTLVLRNVPPVYLEASSGKMRGLVNAVYIGAPDKNGVFDAVLFKPILGNLGIVPAEETTMNYSSKEGKQLIIQFNLQKIPTVIISGDLNAYPNFETMWLQAGSKEADGNFVFRSLEFLEGLKYFDLNSNEVVEVPQTA